MTVNMLCDAFDLCYPYYDLLYQDKDYVKEGRYVTDILRRFRPEAKTLIELGSGTGNYSQVLSDNGFLITGIEKNEQMGAIAKSKSIKGFNAVEGDIISFDVDEKFDAAISLFHVISYLTQNSDIISCLKQTSKHLKPHGVFVFDVWYTPAVYAQMPHTRVKRIENDKLQLLRFTEPEIIYQENVVELDYQLIIKNKLSGDHKTLNEKHRLRHFSTPEISQFAEMAGFTVLGSEEFLTAKQPCCDTWGVCYILRKND